MTLYLLQDNIKYFKDDDPFAATILIVGLGIILAVVIAANIAKHGFKIGGGPGSQRRFSSFSLSRAVKPYGLNREQKKLLEYVFKINGVVDPVHTLTLPSVLDKHFKRAYKEIEKTAGTEEEAQKKLSLLFSVRNIIDVAQNTSIETLNLKLSTNQAATLTVNQESYRVKIISSKQDVIQIDCPRNALGSLIKFPKGTRSSLSFFTKNNKGASIDCSVQGSQDTTFGPVLQLSPAGAVKAMAKRRFRRRQTPLSCGFYLVHIQQSNNKKIPPRMTVEGSRYLGSVVDISVGGCAIKASAAVQVGSRLKIEFENTRGIKPVAVLGQVLRINRSGVVNTILHIKFLKVPRMAMNAINTIVFEFSE